MSRDHIDWSPLGLDPAPGDTGAIDLAVRALGDAHAALACGTRASSALTDDVGDGTWTGPVQQSFHGALGEVPDSVDLGCRSTEQVSHLLAGWSHALTGMQEEADHLLICAIEARDRLAQAQAAAAAASAGAASAARAALNAPEDQSARAADAARAAGAAAASAQRHAAEMAAELERICGLAVDLHDRHQVAGRYVADAIIGTTPPMEALPALLLRMTAVAIPPGMPLTDGDDRLTDVELTLLDRALASGDLATIWAAMDGLSEAERQLAVVARTDQIATTDGVPQQLRVDANRLRLRAHADELGAMADALDPDGLARARIDELLQSGLQPEDLPGLWQTLHQLRTRRDQIERWVDEGRQIILFIPPENWAHGDGRLIEVVSEVSLDDADRVAVFVPGVGTSLDSYDEHFRAGVAELGITLSEGTAVVAWLDYDPPEALASAATVSDARALAAVDPGAAFIDSLDADGRDRDVTLVGHSYGSRAASEIAMVADDIDRLVLVGSPGGGTVHASDYGIGQEDVFVGMNTDDPIRHVADLSDLTGIGHGPDVTDEAFGAVQLPSGTGGHSAYYDPEEGIGPHIAQIIEGTFVVPDAPLAPPPPEPSPMPGEPPVAPAPAPPSPTAAAEPLHTPAPSPSYGVGGPMPPA